MEPHGHGPTEPLISFLPLVFEATSCRARKGAPSRTLSTCTPLAECTHTNSIGEAVSEGLPHIPCFPRCTLRYAIVGDIHIRHAVCDPSIAQYLPTPLSRFHLASSGSSYALSPTITGGQNSSRAVYITLSVRLSPSWRVFRYKRWPHLKLSVSNLTD